MSDGVAVEITVMCVVGDLHEAQDVLKAARKACERDSREVKGAWAWLHADSDKEGNADGDPRIHP